ncbi:MAG: methylamine utilization protein [Bacterioplanes sp.]|nr:methylamine utilization protein [Bacterioplanes sp.]
MSAVMPIFFRMSLTAMLTLAVSLLGLLLSSNAWSQWLTVVDQHGDPVAQAIVTFVGVPSPIDVSQLAVVDQVEQQFSPQQRVIAPGQRVSFPNSDNIRHHVYSFSTPKVFEIRLYADTPEAPILFDQAGVVVLGCNIHDNMIGHLYISADLSLITDDLGRVLLPDGANDIYLWHTRYQLDDEQRLLVRASQWQSSVSDSPSVRLPLAVPLARDKQMTPTSGFGNHFRMGH